MTPYQWIDRMKKTCGIDSDYQAAQALGISRSALSNYKTGKRLTFDETVSLKLANLIGEKPEIVLLDQYAEQAKTPAIRAALKRYCVLCKVDTATGLIARHALSKRVRRLHCATNALS